MKNQNKHTKQIISNRKENKILHDRKKRNTT